jgi:molybdenum cofactor biosynthesis enzyme MoaA
MANMDIGIVEKYNLIRPNKSKLCFAPSSAMVWYQDGRVAACCFNREYILGRYPQESVKDIWLGKRRKELQDAIEKNNLSLGCFDCKNHLLNQNYSAVKALNYDYLGNHGERFDFPLSMDFLLSNTCNLECQMCSGAYSSSIRKNREGLTPMKEIYDETFVEQLSFFLPHLRYANFLGGEPFLVTSYHAIWDKIAELNPDILCGVTTNGTVLNARIKDWMQKLKFHISISIDSLNKERFETIRKNADLDRVLENFAYFRDYAHARGTAITINMTPMINNWMDVPDMVRFANDNGAQIYFTNMWQPPAYALWNKPAHTLSAIHDYLEKNRPQVTGETARTNDALYTALMHDIKTWQQNTVQLPTDPQAAEDIFIQGLQAYLLLNFEASEAADKLLVYKQQLSELKMAVANDWWNKGISIAATYPAELWAGELEVSNTPEKLLYSFLNFTGYYNR